MKKGLTISCGIHAAVLLWGILTFDAKPFEKTDSEMIPVDFISAADFSKLTAGTREAPKAETPKPMVEKVAEKKPVAEQAQKITEKQEITTASTAEPPPPEPEPKKVEPKKEPKPAEAKPEKVEKPEPKTDPIAEALKKEEKKKQEEKKQEEKKKAEAKTPPPLPPKKPTPPQPKFDAAKVAALLDKRDPQRQAYTGEQINRTASLGAPTGSAPELSQSELDALRARLMQLWNPPVGIRNPSEFIIRIRVVLGRDGKMTAPPQVMTSGHGAMFESARDSAIRALFRGQPFDMLRQETYENWRDIEITFDPRDMFRG